MARTFTDVDVFEASRPRLGAIAYRLLGSAGEAEDAVQDTVKAVATFLRGLFQTGRGHALVRRTCRGCRRRGTRASTGSR